MPPAVSDDESELEVATPPPAVTGKVKRDRKAATYTEPVKVEEDDDEEDEDEEDLEPDEYIVEKILAHYIADDGELRFQVKWEGYEDEKDTTWEPEENLIGTATEILEAYFKTIGGRDALVDEPKLAVRTKKRNRASEGAAKSGGKRSRLNGHPADTTPPASKEAVAWKPPSGLWEDDIQMIDMCRDDDTGTYKVYLEWKNGQKTQHNLEVVYRRCPQKMLKFYESHLRVRGDGD